MAAGTFIDNLAFSLFSLSIASLIIVYLMVSVYLEYKKGKKDYKEIEAAATVPLILVGAYMVLSGAFGQFTWPLPGSYNILFYDPLVSFGLVILAFALAFKYNVRYEFVGFFGLLVGIMTIFYGIQGYSIGLTELPAALLALYVFFGVAGIFSYPVSLIMQRLPGLKKNPWIGWQVCLVIFVAALLLAALAAGYVAVSAIPAHLLSPP
jgi:putative membrane protein